ncbi:hypothetical protein TRFO_07931 [Tritrichomonas foetus]|uniref:Uncharacterized protein n=1 Tax=Tritrichomonas foetus TaxID=1144522 RepID=A0A1J4JSV8_9EUKA|nr:hypothetical protein TRFO_07931 [Tritrichomonas foetus]|eukprot:OHT00588.1 hypothetical protein TRFO_07931 [Tritrichomonas foetus]
MIPNLSDSPISTSDDNADIRRLQESNSLLRQKNEKLSLELASLRTQFNEATSISSQLEQIHQKNTKLASDLRNVTIERDELSHRLEINIQVIDELRASKEQDKREAEQRIQTDITEARETFEKTREELSKKLDKSQSDLKEAKKQLQTQQIENENLLTSIKNVVDAAQTYFIQPIKSLDQLASFLQSHTINEKTATLPQPQAVKGDNENDSLLKDAQKQLRIVTRKAKEEHKIRKEAELLIAKLESQKKDIKNELDNLKSRNDSKVLDLQRKLELSEMQKKSISSNLEAKIIELSNLLEKEKQKAQEIEELHRHTPIASQADQATTQAKANSQENKLKEAQASIYSLRKQNATLLNQLSEAENSKELLRKKLQILNDEFDQYRKASDQVKIENSTLSIERDDLKEQLETALTQVQAARSSFKQSQSAVSVAECQIDKLQNSLNISESVLNKQKEEISNLVNDRNKCILSIHKLNDAILHFENVIGRLVDENKQHKKTISNQLRALREAEMLPKSEEIPPTSWFCIDFPRPLCAAISDIAQNVALPTTAKLRNVLSTIAKFYSKLVDDEKKAKELTVEKFNSSLDNFDRFFISLGQIVEDSNLNAEAFLADPRKEINIITYLTDLQNSKLNKRLETSQIEKDLNEILSRLKVTNSSDAAVAIDALIGQINKFQKAIEADKSQQKKMAKALRALKASSYESENNNKNQITEQQNLIEHLQDENRSLTEKLNHCENVIIQLKGQIEDVSQSHSALIVARQGENNEEIRNYQKKLENQKAAHEKEISDRDQILRDNSEKLERYEKEISQWKKTSEMLKAAKAEKDQQIQTLLTQIGENDKDFRGKLEKEKKELKSQYEKSIGQIKAKNNELRELVSNISSALNDSEERNKTLLALNSQMAIEKQQITAKVEAQTEEQNRDKQLTEAKLKTLELSLTTQRQMDLEDERARFEEEKRKIFGIVASNFHTLFDARQQLNDAGFRAFVEKCSAELSKFSRQDAGLRRLLGLSATESVEDAVQKLLLSLYH